jgi:hypothetical protein
MCRIRAKSGENRPFVAKFGLFCGENAKIIGFIWRFLSVFRQKKVNTISRFPAGMDCNCMFQSGGK